METRHRLELLDWPDNQIGSGSPDTRITLRIHNGREIVMSIEDEDFRLNVLMDAERAESVRDWLNTMIELVRRDEENA